MQPTKSFAIPLSFIGIMFFSLGFALGINSLLVPVLQGSLGISNAASYLIIAATFIPFLIFGYPAGLTIKAIGYKKTMSLSFVIFAAAFYLFILSADEKSFPLFLLASFVVVLPMPIFRHLSTLTSPSWVHWIVQPSVSV